MGLDLVVGAYGCFKDPEVLEDLAAQLATVNAALCAVGLPVHQEPTDLAQADSWECQLAYRELHALRRLGAHLGGGAALPSAIDEDEDPTGDPLLIARYAQELADRPFEHLIQHGDAEGWYIPIDFSVPVLAEAVEGKVIGSVQRLYAECLLLRDALEIPTGMTVEDDSVAFSDADAEESQTWQRYPDETYACLSLPKACEVSLATGCAILFC